VERRLLAQSHVAETFLSMLQLADSRLGASRVLALLEARCLDPVRHPMRQGRGWPPGGRVAPDRPALQNAPPAAAAWRSGAAGPAAGCDPAPRSAPAARQRSE